METTTTKQSEIRHAYFQASIILNDGSVISTVLVRDFSTVGYYLGTLKRLYAKDMHHYHVTTYMLTSKQCKELNANVDLLGYSYFSTLVKSF